MDKLETRMRSFKGYIKESVGVNTTTQQTALDQDINPSSIGDPMVVKRINSFLGAICEKEYLIPEHAIKTIRNSLMKIGLSFDEVPQMEGSSGSFDLPLTLFGGRYGKEENTPYDEVIDDDGISHIVEGGLALKIQYEMMPNKNSCKLFAKIE
tara:strand:+ start:2857 stop:3315 length:459 start_codon:yes stop_codon:yes gene_type:complete